MSTVVCTFVQNKLLAMSAVKMLDKVLIRQYRKSLHCLQEVEVDRLRDGALPRANVMRSLQRVCTSSTISGSCDIVDVESWILRLSTMMILTGSMNMDVNDFCNFL